MTKTWTHRKACRLCNSRHVVPVLKFAFTPPDTSFVQSDGATLVSEKIPLIVSLCEKCLHIQLLDVVEPTLMYDTYPHASFSTAASAAHFDDYARQAVTKGHVQKGDLVVDIGCGDGTLLRAFKKLGMNVVGVDPSTQAVAQAKIDGIPVFKEQFSPNLAYKITQKFGQASLVTANYTLASIDNLHAVIAGVRHLLKQDGLFYFEEPCLFDIIENNLFDVVNHERLSFFTAIPLETFFKSTLMHQIDMQRNPFRGGTLRGIVQRSDGPHVVAATLPAMVEQEKKSRLQSVDTLNAFAANVEKVKQELITMVSALKAQGKLVAGYGAGGRTVTFIHECGWESDTIAFVVDDNPYKHDQKLPGTAIPVVHPNAIRDRKPDVLIMFAHHDADLIMKNHEDFKKEGGTFIVPFPRPTMK